MKSLAYLRERLANRRRRRLVLKKMVCVEINAAEISLAPSWRWPENRHVSFVVSCGDAAPYQCIGKSSGCFWRLGSYIIGIIAENMSLALTR